jgi:hypothetical protein
MVALAMATIYARSGPPWLDSLELTENGTLLSRMNVESGGIYVVQTSTNLMDWSTLMGAHSDNTNCRFLDADIDSNQFLFYRVITIKATPPLANPGGPYRFGEEAVTQNVWYATLDGSASTDDFGIVSYIWSFGDGATITNKGPGVSHTWTNDGIWTISLTVVDTAGQTNSASTTITFTPGALPVAVIDGPRLLNEDVCANGLWYGAWDGSASTDDTSICRYEWNFGDGSTGSSSRVSHSYAGQGVYPLALKVYDNGNRTATAVRNVVVMAGDPPQARITASTLVPEGAQPIAFSARTSSDDRGIYSYRWLFPPRRFEFPGQFRDAAQWSVANGVQDDKLIVTGQNNQWGVAYFFSVGPPLQRGASIEGRVDTSTGHSHAMVGLKNLDASSWHYTRLAHAVYFKNGEARVYEYGNDLGLVTRYDKGASYDFRIETKPTAGARYYLRPSGAGQPYVKIFDTDSYSDGVFTYGADVYSGVWGFDDLAVDSLYSMSMDITTPVFPGGTVCLQVVDRAMQTNVASVVVAPVVGAPPTAVINGPAGGKAGVELTYDGYRSSDDDGIASYTWDFGDGSAPVFGPFVTRNYNTPGISPIP